MIQSQHLISISDRIIYSLLDSLKKEAEQFMPIVNKPVTTASCKVMQTFTGSDKTSLIAGCQVTLGTINRQALYRIIRDDQMIFKGTNFDSIRHFKEEVNSIGEGNECGIQINGYSDFKEGDVIEVYEYKDVRDSIE